MDKTISGDYIRPYQISKINNQVFDGYHFTPAHYLSPIAQSVFRQTAAVTRPIYLHLLFTRTQVGH